jgi:hypothetical protein
MSSGLRCRTPGTELRNGKNLRRLIVGSGGVFFAVLGGSGDVWAYRRLGVSACKWTGVDPVDRVDARLRPLVETRRGFVGPAGVEGERWGAGLGGADERELMSVVRGVFSLAVGRRGLNVAGRPA